MRLVGISGSLTVRSKTLIAVEHALEHARSECPDVSAEAISLREYDLQFCDGREPSQYRGDTRRVIDLIVEAEAVIIGTPMYRGSYTGALKNVFDVLPNDALEGKPVGLIATGGTDHHFLAIEHELKPVMGFFRAHVLPGSVYANNGHYSESALADEGIRERLQQLARSVVEFAGLVSPALIGADPPSIPRRSLAQ